MVRVVWFAYLLTCLACGSVISPKAGDAASDGPACQSNQLECDNTCIDPMSDNLHCGDCGTACTATTACSLGHCIDPTASCQTIHALDPTKPNGPYTHAADGKQFYCDMTDGVVQYDELGFGPYNAAVPGFTIVNAADLQNPVIQKAFIWLFNHQNGGGITLTTFSSANCCWTSSAAGGVRLEFGASLLFIAIQGTETCGVSYTTGQLISFERVNVTPRDFAPNPLPDDYFARNPATDVSGICGDSNNPAYFFKRH
jgi:stigma-specific protein Stig1